MTPHMREYLTGLTEAQRAVMSREAVKALRAAWPHRHSLRGRSTARGEATMLRDLRSVGS